MKRIISGALIACTLGAGCASSPLQSRLENNFVYQCSTQLLGKGVSASDAEKICSSSHKGEMAEQSFSAHGNVTVAPVRTPAAVSQPKGETATEPTLKPLPE